MLLESILYTASIGFSLSLGGYFLTTCLIIVATYTIGGMLAVVLDKRLASAWYLRVGFMALGFALSLL